MPGLSAGFSLPLFDVLKPEFLESKSSGPSRLGAAIRSELSLNGYAIDLGLVFFCDLIRDRNCKPVILPEISSTGVGFWSILDAGMKCDRCVIQQIKASRDRVRSDNCEKITLISPAIE